MTVLLNLFRSLMLSGDETRERAESYLAQARDIFELERRMGALAHGEPSRW
jgi:hypothetical protein